MRAQKEEEPSLKMPRAMRGVDEEATPMRCLFFLADAAMRHRILLGGHILLPQDAEKAEKKEAEKKEGSHEEVQRLASMRSESAVSEIGH
jgi:hypothetical protein